MKKIFSVVITFLMLSALSAAVYAGQQIGRVGCTGYTDPLETNHLHFETIGNGNVVDYFQWQ